MAAERPHVLIVDDEADVREALEALLSSAGFATSFAVDAESGLKAMAEHVHDLVLLDIKLPGRSGLAVLQEFRRLNQQLPIIVLTALKDIDVARAAFKNGAQDYLPKPWDAEELIAQIHRALERRKLLEENTQLRRALKARYRLENIVGKSQSLEKIFDLIEQIAPTRSTVLINGESGTGKELVAHTIHNRSGRTEFSFVPVNTGSMPDDLLESILFGHVKGAFTSAIASKKGLFEVAHQGTIFFDEIGTVGPQTQAKLLRVIQEGEFMRLGSNETIKVDVRILAATNVDLKKQVAEGRFREDLYYRLNVIALSLPSLRERREDIPLLVEHFIQKYCSENGKPPRRFTPEAMQLLMDHRWPGNIRELENAVERAIVLSAGEEMDAALLPDEIARPHLLGVAPHEQRPLFDIVDDYERRVILDALDRSGGSQTDAARLLQVPLSTLNQKIKRLGISSRRGAGRESEARVPS
ncbi:MAG: sigma-54-dependent transcriptional regulator [Candidatus Acidiferrales bacterium]